MSYHHHHPAWHHDSLSHTAWHHHNSPPPHTACLTIITILHDIIMIHHHCPTAWHQDSPSLPYCMTSGFTSIIRLHKIMVIKMHHHHHHHNFSPPPDCRRDWKNKLLAWVHGDKQAAGPHQVDLTTLKRKALLVIWKSAKNAQNLLGYDRQHFNVDAVELIKAPPCSSLSNRKPHTTMNKWC